MKFTKHFSTFFALLGPIILFSQVKVGANPNTIDASSIMELESSNKALVLTRLNTSEMNNISPLNGAVIYNMDTACVHYFDGTQWINLCDVSNASGFSFTDNGDGTITLTDGQGDEITFNGAPETVTTLTDNLDGTYTYTNEAGSQTIITNTDNQTLGTNGTAGHISISGGNSILLNINDADADDQNEIQDLEFNAGVITLTNDPSSTTIDLSNYDDDVTNDFDGDWNSLSNIPPDIADGDADTTYSAGTGLSLAGTIFSVNNGTIAPDWTNITNIPPDIADGDANTLTNLSQDNGTGVITYTNEAVADQTANVVGTEVNNSISVGANGGAFYESPIKAFGKIDTDGSIIRATAGITITKLAGNGHYRVNLPVGLVADADYIIQLAQPSRQGAGADDPGIAYLNQTSTDFEVIIGDNDNGGTDRARFDSEFMFTILDL